MCRRTGPGNEDGMARYIFIVSVQHPALYDYLVQRFAGDPNAQVVLDRRRIERRQAEIAVTRERRQADRRQRPDVSEELRRRSVAVVTISDAPGES
jgi:C-terminal processing protease CtpA/Prc